MHYIIGVDEAGRGPWAGPVVAGGFMMAVSESTHISTLFPGLDDSKKLSEYEREHMHATIEHLSHKQSCQYTFAYRDADRIDDIGIRMATKETMEDVILSLTQFLNPKDTYEIWIDGCDNFTFETLDSDLSYHFAKKKKRGKKTCSIGEKNPDDFDLHGDIIDAVFEEIQEASYISGISENESNIISKGNQFGGRIFSPILEKSDIEMNTLSFLINGDSLHPFISLASIIAKVMRDRIMCEYNEEFPEFSFHEHKGYGTRKHQEELINYGITFIHRKSYAPVKKLISSTSSL